MARVKNARGGPGDVDLRPPPRLTSQEKGKAKKTTMMKRKLIDAEAKRLVAVAAAVERAERGAWSGVHIVDQLSPSQRSTVERVESLHGSLARTIMLGGQRVALEESLPQGETI